MAKWIIYKPEDIGCYNCRCSLCKKQFFFPSIVREPYRYCPHCGIRMEFEDDNTDGTRGRGESQGVGCTNDYTDRAKKTD